MSYISFQSPGSPRDNVDEVRFPGHAPGDPCLTSSPWVERWKVPLKMLIFIFIHFRAQPRPVTMWMRLDSRAMRLETRASRHRPGTWNADKPPLKFPGIFRPPTFQVEVRKFNLYGTLRKSKTEIHNTLPSPECKSVCVS